MGLSSQRSESGKKDSFAGNIAFRVSAVTVFINILLSALKLAAGVSAHSGAMVSDALHSASDVLSTFVVIIGIALASRKSDEGHPYGHERMECVVAIVLAAMLAATGLGIGYAGFNKLTGNGGRIQEPGAIALAAAVISIVIKECMYWYTRRAAEKIRSGALMADAWHHRSDSLSSVGAFIGILGARAGFPILDPVVCVVISIFIEKAALDIFKDAVEKMVDKSGPKELRDRLYTLIEDQNGVEAVDDIKTRMFAAKLYVDVEIAVDGAMTLTRAHGIAEQVHKAVESEFPEVKHCMVHVNPVKEIRKIL